MKILYPILALLCVTIQLQAQNGTCATELMRAKSSDQTQKDEAVYRTLREAVMGRGHAPQTRGGVRTIPVVVHIMHQNGPENLSDAVVMAGIEELNARFQNAAPYTDATGHAVGVQFCLASVDPQGNATTGITHNFSQYAYLWAQYDVDMKNTTRWDPLNYYNIWVVASISGFNISVSGYSSLPSNLGDAQDGVVIDRYSLSGSVLAHETGHYLGLQHTFNGGCANANSLLDGDMVSDTPPDTSTGVCMGNSCSTEMDDLSGFNPFSGDVDELPNYMDYSPCPLSFSQGQADRMNDALTDIRFQLLASMGCGFDGSAAPVADLGIAISVCNDGIVTFSDALTTGGSTANWDFQNDGTYDSFLHNPTFTYPATGTYTVRLVVVGQGGTDVVTQTIFVQRGTTLYYPITTLGGTFTNAQGQLASCPSWSINLEAAPSASYLWSTGETSQNITINTTSSVLVTLTTVDSKGHTWTNAICHPLNILVTPAPPAPILSTTDEVAVCAGEQITLHSDVGLDPGYDLNWYQNSQSLDIHDTVVTFTVPDGQAYYQIVVVDTNWCTNYSNIVYATGYSYPVQQSFTQNGLDLNTGWGGGTAWYHDGDLIPGAGGMDYTVTEPGCYTVEWFFGFAPNCRTMSDPICFTSVDIEQARPTYADIALYPMPAEDVMMVTVAESMIGANLQLLDATGRIVLQEIQKTQTQAIPLHGLSAGVYTLLVGSENGEATQRVMISR